MASTYLTRTQSSDTSNTNFTFSCWIKRSNLGNQCIYATQTGSDEVRFEFDSNDRLFCYKYNGSSFAWNLYTNRRFMDTAAFYHIVLQYDSNLDKFEGKHINDIINDAGLFTTSDTDPSGTGVSPAKWIIPHAISYTVTLASDGRVTDTPFRWWKNGANAGQTTGANDTLFAASVLKLDSLFRPDILMYDGVTYTFTCSSLGSGNGFFLTSDLENEFTTGASSTSVASGTAITENGTYTFTPTSSTPRILYYRTQAAVNTGGRILIRTP